MLCDGCGQRVFRATRNSEGPWTRAGDHVASRVHALLVGDVVAALDHPGVAACAHSLAGPLSAGGVVELELLEWFPGSGEDHHARTGGHRAASAERQDRREHQDSGPSHGLILHLWCGDGRVGAVDPRTSYCKIASAD